VNSTSILRVKPVEVLRSGRMVAEVPWSEIPILVNSSGFVM
jgi:hypothetical protein